jgi:DNA-directed RNA polymerase specialized sigma subunit
MITKQQLKSIPHLDARINSKLNQARELRERALCVQSSNTTTDRVQSSRHPDPMVLVDKLVDAEAAINADIDELISLRAEAAAVFGSLPERDKTLMELRYLEGLTWSQVAERTGYTYRHVTKIHGKILFILFPE